MDDENYLDFVKAYETAEKGASVTCSNFDMDCNDCICFGIECGKVVGENGEERYLFIKSYLIEKGLYSEQLEFVF